MYLILKDLWGWLNILFLALELGAPLIKFLPYLAKIQILLPRGKTILSKRKASKSRTMTEPPPPQVCFSSPNRQYHSIIILPLRCRNSTSTICRLYNRAIQLQGGIHSAWGCITYFFAQALLKLDFGISSIRMNVDSLSINPFLLLPTEWPSVYY